MSVYITNSEAEMKTCPHATPGSRRGVQCLGSGCGQWFDEPGGNARGCCAAVMVAAVLYDISNTLMTSPVVVSE